MMKKINKKGFSLMEVIFYMVLVGILIGIAVPSLGKLKERAELTKIRADSKTIRNIALLEGENYEGLDLDLKLDSIKGRAFLNGKRINDIPKGGEFFEVIDPVYTASRTTLGGQFYGNRRMDIIYMDDGSSVDKPTSPEKPVTPGDTDTPEKPVTPGDKEPEEPATEKEYDKYDEYLATDEDFKFVPAEFYGPDYFYYPRNGASKKERGYFEYVGKAKIVKIPKVIHGNEMKSYVSMFEGKSIEKVISDNPNIENINGMFVNTKSSQLDIIFRTDSLKVTSYAFKGSLSKINLIEFDTSNVVNMQHMFEEVEKDINFGDKFRVDKVENMSGIFLDAKVSNLDLSHWNTQNAINMSGVFSGVKANVKIKDNFVGPNAKNISGILGDSDIKGIDVSNWDVSGVEYFNNMFINSKFKELDLSKWNTKNGKEFSGMFFKTSAETIRVDNFNLQNAETLMSMFEDSLVETLDLSSFSLDVNPRMHSMFLNSKVKTIYIKPGTEDNYRDPKVKLPAGVSLIEK